MKISQNILEILERCRIEGNILYLPDEQLNRNDIAFSETMRIVYGHKS